MQLFLSIFVKTFELGYRITSVENKKFHTRIQLSALGA